MKISGKILLLRVIVLFLISVLYIPEILDAETVEPGRSAGTGSVEAEIRWSRESRNPDWLKTADRLMAELLAIDVRLYSLINTVGNEKSRMALIRQRSINRKLIYDLTAARNTVVEEQRRNRDISNSGSFRPEL